MTEVRDYREGSATDVTRRRLRPQAHFDEVPSDWSLAQNTASSDDDEFRVWEAFADEVFDDWEESLKKRQ